MLPPRADFAHVRWLRAVAQAGRPCCALPDFVLLTVAPSGRRKPRARDASHHQMRRAPRANSERPHVRTPPLQADRCRTRPQHRKSRLLKSQTFIHKSQSHDFYDFYV